MNDNVKHPSHYTNGDIECIDAIKASMSPDQFNGYLKGNCLKYLWRYEDKGGVEDLAKAQVYLQWLIENREKQEIFGDDKEKQVLEVKEIVVEDEEKSIIDLLEEFFSRLSEYVKKGEIFDVDFSIRGNYPNEFLDLDLRTEPNFIDGTPYFTYVISELGKKDVIFSNDVSYLDVFEVDNINIKFDLNISDLLTQSCIMDNIRAIEEKSTRVHGDEYKNHKYMLQLVDELIKYVNTGDIWNFKVEEFENTYLSIFKFKFDTEHNFCDNHQLIPEATTNLKNTNFIYMVYNHCYQPGIDHNTIEFDKDEMTEMDFYYLKNEARKLAERSIMQDYTDEEV